MPGRGPSGGGGGGGAAGSPFSLNGDLVTVPLIPTVSLNAQYNLLPANGRTFTAGAGSVTLSDRLFLCQSGATIYGYGTLQSFRAVNTRASLGVTLRAAAIFPDAVALTWLGVGGFTIGDEVSFGRNGINFGVWHRYGGGPEVRELQITTAASGGESATVTVNGTGHTIPLTGGGTEQQDAYEIAAYLDANEDAWSFQQLDDKVIASAKSDGAKSNTFAFSSSTAVGSWSQTTAGVTKTSDFVPQTDWNGGAPENFDPTQGNNYQIKYSNGFGCIKYYVEDQKTGVYKLVHTIRQPSAGTEQNMGNANLHVGAYAASIGATTNARVHCGHVISFVDGLLRKTRNPRGYSNTKSIGTSATNILTIRTARNLNGLTNQSEILPVYLTLSNDGGKSAVFELRGNPTISGTPNFQEVGTNLISAVDVAGTTSSGGRLLGSFSVAKGQSIQVDLTKLEIVIPPTLRLAVTGRMASGASSDLTAALTWYEDI